MAFTAEDGVKLQEEMRDVLAQLKEQKETYKDKIEELTQKLDEQTSIQKEQKEELDQEIEKQKIKMEHELADQKLAHQQDKDEYEAHVRKLESEAQAAREFMERSTTETTKKKISFSPVAEDKGEETASQEGSDEGNLNSDAEDDDKKKKKDDIRGYDHKSCIKPDQYDGKSDKFSGWHELFTAQLSALDEKWENVLLRARAHKVKLTENDILEIMKEVKIDIKLKTKMNRTMYISLLQYTAGDAHGKVVSNGLPMALDTYRYLYQKGKNETTVNMMKFINKTMYPEAATDINDVEKKINKWKEDIRCLGDMGRSDLTQEQMMTILTSMVPDELADHLVKFIGMRPNLEYDDLELEAIAVVDRILQNKDRGSKKKNIGAVENGDAGQGHAHGKGHEDNQELYYWDEAQGGFIGMAVPGGKRRRENDDEEGSDKDMPAADERQQKGKGKGKGPKTGCFTCGGTIMRRSARRERAKVKMEVARAKEKTVGSHRGSGTISILDPLHRHGRHGIHSKEAEKDTKAREAKVA